jgi:uncharacterized protein
MPKPKDSGAGRRFDAFRLASGRGAVAGTLDARDLPRLADLLAEDAGPAIVGWRIAGGAAADGHVALTVALEGVLPLTCQRCLGRLDWPVAQRTELLLARDDAELARLDADSDGEVIVAAEPLDPAALVEDELLLTVPFVPRHEGTCPV